MIKKVLTTMGLVLWLASASSAQVPSFINYQGMLTNAGGSPLNGNHTINFRIYDAPSGGSLLWGPQDHTVIAEDGIFSVELGPIGHGIFNGDERFLSLQVGSDEEMMPRKKLLTVGYSFRSFDTDKVDGQELSSDDGAVNQGTDPVSWSKIKDIPPGFADGTDDVGAAGGISQLSVGNGLTVTNPEGPTTIIGLNMGPGNKINADQVDGKHASDFAAVSHDHKGENITSGKISNTRLQTGAGNGLDADMVDGKHASELSDNLGDHTATKNIQLKGKWISNDGDDEGIMVQDNGVVKLLNLYAESGDQISSLNVSSGAVYGANNKSNAFGYLGGRDYGVYGKNANHEGYIGGDNGGAFGRSGDTVYGYLGTSGGYGAYGRNSSRIGYLGGPDSGVHGQYDGRFQGSLGTAQGGAYGRASDAVYGYLGSSNGYGAFGRSGDLWGFLGGTVGAYGQSLNTRFGWLGGGNAGAYGQFNSNIYGFLGTKDYGVYGKNGSRWGFIGGPNHAGYFQGNVHVNGIFLKSGGSFKIDHPLDPANKYLNHSFVESPDMMNIYNGNVTLDMKGEAWVELPDWFEALNKDHRYQLTCIGGFAQVYIAEKISNNRFKIAGGTSGMEVSWQVTGVRQDAYANANRVQVEVEKHGKERGKYLAPEEHGMSKRMGIHYDEWSTIMEATEKNQAEMRALPQPEPSKMQDQQ